jgi:hypothetical protein
MNRIAIAGAVLVGGVALVGLGYWMGQRTEERDASRYLFDVTSHMALSCANEHIVALTGFREGKADDAIRGLELLAAAKLESLDANRISDTTIAKKSFTELRGPLNLYQAKFKSPVLDPTTNPRLSNLLGAGR